MLQSNRVLQKEQADLYAIEKKLVKVLPVIHEALNSLKVEELHLKAQSVHQVMSTAPSTSSAGSANTTSHQVLLMPNEQINRQEIDLQLLESELQQFDVENDSD